MSKVKKLALESRAAQPHCAGEQHCIFIPSSQRDMEQPTYLLHDSSEQFSPKPHGEESDGTANPDSHYRESACPLWKGDRGGNAFLLAVVGERAHRGP